MALIRCRDCGNPVSKSAASCPSCGRPVAGRKTEQTTGFGALLVVASLILGIVLMIAIVVKTENIPLAFGVSVVPVVLAFAIASFRKKGY